MNSVLLPDELLASLGRLLGYQQDQRDAAERGICANLCDLSDSEQSEALNVTSVRDNACVNDANYRQSSLEPSGKSLQQQASKHCISWDSAQDAQSSFIQQTTPCYNLSTLKPFSLSQCQGSNGQQMPIQTMLCDQSINSQSYYAQLPTCNTQMLALQQPSHSHKPTVGHHQDNQQPRQHSPDPTVIYNQQNQSKQQSHERYVTRSQSAPVASTNSKAARECQRGMSNFCSPEKNENIIGLQRSTINQQSDTLEAATSAAQQHHRTPCLANAPGGNPYLDQQSHLNNNTTCCSGNNDSSNLGMSYGSWQRQQQQQQQQPQCKQQQLMQQKLFQQQQQVQHQHQQQQQHHYDHFHQQYHHHYPLQGQQQQQQQQCLNNNASFNRFKPTCNSTRMGEESPRLAADTNCIQHPVANRSCMPQAQPYRPTLLRGAPPGGPATTNTQRCNATYMPPTRMMQPPTPSNIGCGQRTTGTPEITQQRLRFDNRSFDETSYMQLPQIQQQPQSQAQVSFRDCPTSTPRPKAAIGSQCCPQASPHSRSSNPAQSLMSPTGTSTPRGSRFPGSFDMSTFNETSVQDCTSAGGGRSKSRVYDTGDLTPEERFVRRTKSLFFDVLVKDHTCPGVIQETLDGKEDFNEYAFEIAFAGDIPNKPEPIDPITILEAIKLRIDHERTEIRKSHVGNVSSKSELHKSARDRSRDRRLARSHSPSGSSSRDRSRRTLSETKMRQRSGPTEEDIENHFATKNKSEVNDAVSAFLQAESEYRSASLDGDQELEANVNVYESKLMGMNTTTYTATTRRLD